MKSALVVRGFSWLLIPWLLSLAGVRAADRYWVGSGGNWSSADNWSTESGGAGGASVPGTGDRAIFDGNSGDCIVNGSVDVGGILLRASFGGTVTQSDSARIQIRGQHYEQGGGTFQGGTNDWILNGGNFTCTGGTFNAGVSQRIVIPQTFVADGNCFNPQSSTVFFQSQGATLVITNIGPADLVFYRFWAGNWSTSTDRNLEIRSGTTVRVLNRLVLTNSAPTRGLVINGPGLICVEGDLWLDGASYHNGNGTIRVEGTGDQTLTGHGGTLPILVIDKPAGTCFLEGTLSIRKNLSFLSGAVDAGQSTLRFLQGLTVTGTVALANVLCGNQSSSTDQTLTFAGDTVVTVRGQLTLLSSSGKNLALGGSGRLEAQGDLLTDNQNYSGGLWITGEADQQWLASTTTLASLVIRKSGGTLSLGGTLNLIRSLQYESGTIEPGNSHLRFFVPMFSEFTLSNAIPLFLSDVTLGKIAYGSGNYWDGTFNMTNGSEIVVGGTLTFSNAQGTGTITVRGGTLRARGDVFIATNGAANGYNAAAGALLRLEGAATQTLTAVSGGEYQMRIPIRVVKEGGEVRLGSSLGMAAAEQHFVLERGILNLDTHNLMLFGTGADFKMLETETGLRALLWHGGTRIQVNRQTEVRGSLTVELDPNYLPAPSDTITFLTAGLPVSGTFAGAEGTKGRVPVRYVVQYNEGGNNIKLTQFRLLGGTLINIR